jgi:hypothetical protein
MTVAKKKTRTPDPEFIDAVGRKWSVPLTVWHMRKINEELDVDISGAMKSGSALAQLLFGDVQQTVAILWILCEPQATAANVTPEEFGRGFDGATLEAAGEALLSAVAMFMPRSAIGTAVRDNLLGMLDQADAAGVKAINDAVRAANDPPPADPKPATGEEEPPYVG